MRKPQNATKAVEEKKYTIISDCQNNTSRSNNSTQEIHKVRQMRINTEKMKSKN